MVQSIEDVANPLREFTKDKQRQFANLICSAFCFAGGMVVAGWCPSSATKIIGSVLLAGGWLYFLWESWHICEKPVLSRLVFLHLFVAGSIVLARVTVAGLALLQDLVPQMLQSLFKWILVGVAWLAVLVWLLVVARVAFSVIGVETPAMKWRRMMKTDTDRRDGT